MTQDDREGIQLLISKIQEMIDASINKADFDRTIKVRVLRQVSNNKYKIEYNGKEYTATSSIVLKPDEWVYATVAKNNFSNIVIAGSVGSGGSGGVSTEFTKIYKITNTDIDNIVAGTATEMNESSFVYASVDGSNTEETQSLTKEEILDILK